MSIKVGRFIDGMFMNQLEYLVSSEGTPKEFESQEQAEQYLLDNGVCIDDLEYMVFEPTKEEEIPNAV